MGVLRGVTFLPQITPAAAAWASPEMVSPTGGFGRDLGLRSPATQQAATPADHCVFWLVSQPRSERSHVPLRKSS